jgi:hypothetical protein
VPEADAVLASLRRIERMLDEIHGAFETSARAHHFHHFSLARLSGALLQSLVVLLIVFALSDWVYAASEGKQLVKLAFAGVLQLGALTAFVVARGE